MPEESQSAVGEVSHAQRAFWLAQHLDRSSVACNVFVSMHFPLPFEPRAASAAFEEIARGHAALRTRLPTVAGAPVRRVEDYLPIPLAIIEAGDWSLEEVHREARRCAREPFDLEVGPLLRVYAFVREDGFVLTSVGHHAALDFMSVVLINHQFLDRYRERLDGHPPVLPEQIPTESDDAAYIEHERSLLTGPQAERFLGYWQEQLTDLAPRLVLPTDRNRTAQSGQASGLYRVELPDAILQSLKDLTKAHASTTYVLLLAAIGAWLYRIGGQSDFFVGTTFSLRRKSHLKAILGPLINTVPLRMRIDPGISFSGWHQQVKGLFRAGWRNGAAPFVWVVDNLPRDLLPRGIAPTIRGLTPVVFNFAASGLDPTPTTALDWGQCGAATEVMITIYVLHGRLSINFNYDPTLFDAATIEALAQSLIAMLAQLHVDPDLSIDALPLVSTPLDDDDRDRLVGPSVAPPASTFPHAFLAQCKKTPERIAVASAGRTLTYAELNARANAAAAALTAGGVTGEQVVGLLAPRGPDAITALIAIQKAGAAFLFLDAPLQRWRTLLTHAGVKHLIVAREMRDSLLELDVEEGRDLIVTLESLLGAGDPSEASDPPDARDPARLAYVMFTSGSTGAPKAVGVEQGGMVNHNYAKICELDLGPSDVLLQSAAPGFVISVWQMLAPLMVGARVYVVDDATMAEPTQLFGEIAAAGVTIVQTVPSLLRVWLEQPCADVLGDLRVMISTGEVLTPALARRWFERFGDVPLLNAFGPTECSDDIAHAWLTAAPGRDVTRVGVGRPIANTEITVRDAALRRLPTAVPGEICVSGASVARGYLGGEETDAARFVVDPADGKRLYRTGDRGRLRADGSLDFLGRADNQIKLRGHRIELGEIEAAIAEIAGVSGSAVCLVGEQGRDLIDERSDDNAAAHLIGYVVPNDPSLIARVTDSLSARLPAVMRPSRLIGLDALPLNRNGKLDRARLPRPAPSRPETTPPRNDQERALVSLWCELLALDDVGIHDDFFALGGHSLILMEMSVRLEAAVGATLPVAELFSLPTIAELAARLRHFHEAAGVSTPTAAHVMREEGRDSISVAPLSAAQERFWIVEQLQPLSPQLNLAAAIRLRGPLEVEVLEAAFGDLITRHEALRTRFVAVEGRPRQEIHATWPPGGPLRVGVTELAGDSPQQTAARALELCAEAAAIGFDVAVAPLLRVHLYRLSDTDHVLSVVTHHLVCDGWSVGVLIRDGLDFYAARARGDSLTLPSIGMQLGDFALAETARSDADLRGDLDYWRRRLAGAEPLDLPRAHMPQQAQAQRMESVGRTLAGGSLAGLRRLARTDETSLFRVLLASLQALLARACGQLDVSVAVPTAYRERPELQHTVGFLINSLIIRCDLGGDPTFRQLLDQVHHRAIEAAGHQELPFERLLRVLQREAQHPDSPDSNEALSPMQTYLTYNRRGVERWVRGPLVLELLELPPPSPFVDLSFYVDEFPDRLELRATYDANQFDIDQVAQMLEHWEAILACVAEDPDRPLSDLPLTRQPWRAVGAVGRERGRAPPAPTPWSAADVAGTVSARFASIASRFADRPAVVTPGGQLTYGELHQRTADLARKLTARRDKLEPGGPGRVALLFHNDDLLLPAAVLGTLAAGDAFVSLDSTHPESRLREVIASAEPYLLVHDPALAERAARLLPTTKLLAIDASFGDARPPALPSAASTAYLLFTSGSAGQPKGVVQTHRNLIHFMRAFGAVLGGVGPGDRVSLLANAAHDAGLMDFFVALLHGATLYPMDVRRRGLGESIEWIEKSQINVVHTTPTFFRAWTNGLSSKSAPSNNSLRAIVFDGEPSLRQDVETFAALFASDARLVNCYGSTESSISMHTIVTDAADLPERAAFCLEGPVDRTGVRLMTTAGEQASLYGVGEIVISSPYVTSGYWRDPALTDAVFTDAGEMRIYHTGDLGRILPGGWLEIVGRKDRQIKILGQRVELAEIEARLRELSGAADACVIYRELRPGQYRLEAYVTAPSDDNGGGNDPDRLIDRLRDALPEYMVPQRCMVLERIPRTPNTKVDFPALLALGDTEEEPAGAEPTANAIESELCTMVGELLGLTRVPLDRSFFDLGGDSLQLLELHHRLHARYADLEAVELFRFPTIRGLARRLAGGTREANMSAAKARAGKRRAALARHTRRRGP